MISKGLRGEDCRTHGQQVGTGCLIILSFIKITASIWNSELHCNYATNILIFWCIKYLNITVKTIPLTSCAAPWNSIHPQARLCERWSMLSKKTSLFMCLDSSQSNMQACLMEMWCLVIPVKCHLLWRNNWLIERGLGWHFNQVAEGCWIVFSAQNGSCVLCSEHEMQELL